MDQSFFLLDGYRISLHKVQDNLIIEVENCETDKIYKHIVTNQAISALNLFFLNNINDLQDLLRLGITKSNPKTKVYIEQGPILNLEATVKFGKSDRTSKIPFKLEEEQNINSTENCERILKALMEEGLKDANPVESQIIRVLKELVTSVKKSERNITNISSNVEHKLGNQNKQGSGSKVDEKIVELEKNINVRLEQIERKAIEAKMGDVEENFAEVNKKIDSVSQLLANTSRNETAMQSKLEQLAADVERAIRELDKTRELIYKLETSSSKTDIVKKVTIPAPADVVKSESFIANNCDIKIFKTSKELVFQVIDLGNSDAYSKTLLDSGAKSLTLNNYPDTTILYDALSDLVKSDTGKNGFGLSEGKLMIIGLKKTLGLKMEKIEVPSPHDAEKNDVRVEQLSSDFARVLRELDQTREQIHKLEARSSNTEATKNAAKPVIAAPADVVKSESFTVNNCDIKIFKTSKELVFQVVDLTSTDAYSKTLADSGAKSLTLNNYPDTTILYDALSDLVKSEIGKNGFSLSEGKLTVSGLKKTLGVKMEKIDAAKTQEAGTGDVRFEQLNSDLARVLKELDQTREQIHKLEAAPRNAESAPNALGSSLNNNGAPYPVVPLTEVVQAESFVVNGCEIELFKTTKELVIQVEDLITSRVYYKMIVDSQVKNLTVNMFPNFGSLFDFLVELSKSEKANTEITFAEGRIGIPGPKKKFYMTLEKKDLDSFAACERIVRKFTDKAVEPEFLFEKRLKEAIRKIFDQEKKLSNMVAESVMKLEQIEKTVEDL